MHTRTTLIAHCATILLTARRDAPRRRRQDEEESVHRAARIVELVEELYPPEAKADPEIMERLTGAEATAEAHRGLELRSPDRRRSTA